MLTVAGLLTLSLVLGHMGSCEQDPISGGRIVGGNPVSVVHHPWFLAFAELERVEEVLKNPLSKLRVFCGGALISTTHALTAAHCFQGHKNIDSYSKNDSVGLLGLRDRCIPKWDSVVTIADIVVHDKYNTTQINGSDIALIFLSKPVEGIMPLCLPPAGPQHTGDVEVVGFGTTKEVKSSAELENATKCTMMGATITEFSRADCLKTGVKDDINRLPEAMCAGVKAGGKDTCKGDSGGPLIYLKSGRRYLEGIASLGIGCGRPNYPGLYVHVAYYLDWIVSTINTTQGKTENGGKVSTQYFNWFNRGKR